MSPQMNGEPRDSSSTAALASSGERPAVVDRPPVGDRPAASIPGDRPLLEPINVDGVNRTALSRQAAVTGEDATLAALFTDEAAADFRSRWDRLQRSFVDDPRAAVRAGDELVAQVIGSLAETFADQRSQLDIAPSQSDQSSTETLRLALRRYRSFFERLLSI
jgi:hypothetical protein